MKTFLLALALTLLCGAGCKTLPPTPVPTAASPEAVLARVKARQAGVQTFTARGRLTLLSPQRNFTGTGILTGSLPSSLRVDLLDPLGRTAASFASDGREVQVLLPREGRLLKGEATPANLAAFLPPGVTLPQILRLLTGDLPLSDGPAARMQTVREQDAYLLEWLNQDGSLRERLWIATQDGNPVKVAWHDTDGRLRYTAELGDYGRLTPVQPQTIAVRTTEPPVELRLAFREMQRNAAVTPADLTLTPPPGVVAEPLGR